MLGRLTSRSAAAITQTLRMKWSCGAKVVTAPVTMIQAFGLTHWNEAARQKPSGGLRMPPDGSNPDPAIRQASTSRYAAAA